MKRLLKSITEDKATGPDGMPGKVLKRCHKQFAPVIARLARLIIARHQWPHVWRHHRIHPLYKKRTIFNALNDTGLHLTTNLSNIVERSIGMVLGPFLDINAFGDDQWAFRSRRTCRDLVFFLVCSWLITFEEKQRIGIYLSDISGAFDRVDRDILAQPLQEAGVGDGMCRFIRD